LLETSNGSLVFEEDADPTSLDRVSPSDCAKAAADPSAHTNIVKRKIKLLLMAL